MKWILSILLIMYLAFAAFPQKKSDLTKLIETEQSFARTAREKGTKAAFLEFLADDGVVFQPTAVNGKEFWKARAESAALLSWEPVWADISGDGTLGYTTGPWEYRPKGKDDEPAAFGQYVTVWRKQKDGSFKAVLDIGISHAKPEFDAGCGDSAHDAGINGSPGNYTKFPEITESANLTLFLASDARIYRDGAYPLLDREGIGKLLRLESDTRKVIERICIGGEELRYCHGTIEVTPSDVKPQRGNFLQIWKHREGKWKIVLDLFIEIPEGD